MTYCQFKEIERAEDGRYAYQCVHCKQIVRHHRHVEAGDVRDTCRVQMQVPCRHRGDEQRRALCESCAGKVQIKVFACTVFKECTIETALTDVQACAGCPRYEAKE